MNRLALLLAIALLGPFCRVQGAATTADPAGCGTLPADIEFLLDTSGSVQQSNFNKVKAFVKKFAQSFDIGPNGVHIGISTFDTHPRNEFWLNAHTDKASLVAAIDHVRYPAGNTHTGEALKFVRENAFTKAHGDRDRITNILIVVTDGRSNNKPNTLKEAAELHKTNMNVFAVGVGSNLDHSELEAIASNRKNVFTVTNFDALDTLQATLKKTACEVDGHWTKWGFYSPCTKSCGGGRQYRERSCTDPAPANGGKNCIGRSRENRDCNTQACPTSPPPTTTTTPATTTTPIPGCGVQPADILFIVDSSGSVGASNFQKTLGFIQNMTNGFNVGPHDIQIGMITFDTKPYLQFHLNKFHNRNDVINAVGQTHYTKGGTYTHLALKYASDTSFTPANGARANAAKIAIVITDGKSQNPSATAQEAQKLRDKGITVFSIGVGSGIQESELKAMATDPDNQHVFVVNNFDALDLIKASLQQKACEVKPTMNSATPPPANCGGKADIVFLLDKSGSVGQGNFNKMLEFVKDVSSNFDIGPNDVQIGVDTFSTSFSTEFTLGKFADKHSVSAAVDRIPYNGGGTLTGPAITKMTTQSFTTAAGHRAGIPKIAVVVTDGRSNNPSDTAAAAQKARAAGIHMLAIGVGTGVDEKELDAIASDPDSQNVFRAATFDSLKSLKSLLAAKACEQVQQTPSHHACGTKADIVFMLDSSGSVGSSNFKLLLSFVNSLTKDWDISQDKIRVGVEKFSSRPYTEFHLNHFNDKQQMLTAINKIKYQSGGTNTGDALRYMKDTMFNGKNGDRPGVPNIGIIITDGKSNRPDQTKAQAAAARKAGIVLFSVGVGSGISRPELNEMATDPDSSHVFTVDDFSKLAQIKALFQEQTCDAIPATLPPYTPTSSPPSGPLVDPCQDHIPNCASYDSSSCTNFVRWAQDNCPRYCGFCATSIPTTPPPCVDVLNNCPSYAITSCSTYKPWALDNCRKYCGFCVDQTVGVGYFGKCYYKGQQYSQGAQWQDGCAYDCECNNAAIGQYQCYNKCPTYYNLPPQCTLVQQPGQCCLQPVCNFDAKYQTTSGQNVGDLNGNKVCVYNGRKYYQSQTWTVGCDLECICDDAGVGLYACQSKCASYGTLPSNCKLVKHPGECCAKPECEFNTQVGTFTGKGQPSGPGDNGMATTPPPCVDKLADCASFDAASCTSASYRPWALENCRKTCNLCNTTGVPGPDDVCVYKGMAFKQGQQWDDGCEKTCVCENAAFGYYRCDNKCPDFYNMPPGCALVPVAGQCCKAMRCDSGTITGSQTVPNTIGAVPLPYARPTMAPGLMPGGTLAPGMTLPAYLTAAPGQTLAPGFVPGQTLAPGVTIPWYLTPAPGKTYAPTPFTTPAPLIPGQTLPPGQTIPSYITPAPGQTFAPGIVPGWTLAPGVTVPLYLTPKPGQTYAPVVTNPYATPAPIMPGRTLAPGQTIPPYITPAPGHTFAPGIVPGQTLAPGVTVPQYLTPAPGQTYAPGKTPPPNTPAPLIPGRTLPPGQTIPLYITPVPGQTFAPGIVPGQTLAPGVTVPQYLTPRPGQTYAPQTTRPPVPLIPGITLPPGQTIPSYITPAPGQTFAPGIRPGQTLAPGVTVPVYLTPRPGQTYAPDTTPGSGYPIPGLMPGGTLAPGQTIPLYLTPVPGQTFAPGIVPGHTLAPGVTVPWNMTPRPGQTYPPDAKAPPVPIVPGQTLAPGQTLPRYITPVPGHTFAPGILPGQTLAPGVTVPVYLTPLPGQTYGPYPTAGQVPGIIVGGQVPGMISGMQTPQKLSGCVYKNSLYQQGQRWSDGCDFTCVCEDGSTGRYRCSPKCLAFTNLDPKCTLQDDPSDPCCKTPNCPAGVTVVPSIGQAVTGFAPAVYPNTGGTVGGVPGGTIGGSNTIPGTSGSTSAPISGQRTGCVYNGHVYQKGATWQEGCQYTCECVDDQTGFYRCTDVCHNFQNLPPQCRLIPDPNNSCCKTYVCDVQVTTTQASIAQGGVHTPVAGVDYCVYNGRYYRQGEEWYDGCSLKCRCEDARHHYHQCTTRCPAYTSVPLGCRMVPDTKDPQCCKMPECDSATGQPGSGISGSQTPLGFIGTFSGTGRPANANIGSTGYRRACLYKGQIYSQGQTWQDGCDLDCECTDALSGLYRCTDRCQRYAALPSGCKLIQDPNDQCCVKAECAPPTNGQCRDVKDNCFTYGKFACQAPYTAWAKDNCAYYCGFCGTQTTQSPADCADKIPNCQDYGHDGCVGTYEAWARYNCPKFCGYCGANSQVTTASSVIVVSGQPGQGNSGTGQVGSCRDVLPNCDQYGPESCNDPYRGWAIDNCAKHCNLCSLVGQTGLVTGSGQVVTGQTIGCFYKGRIYGHGEEWQDGCDYNCTCVNGQTGYYRCGARCLTYDHLPAGCRMEKQPNECCSLPVCDGQVINGQTKGCLYKGQLHPESSQWNDGCDYKCTCQDGTTGRYQCTARCVTWNLPAACTLDQPAAGKCCPTPHCPAGYTINYPPGYVAD